jgi:dipeptidase E
MAHLPLFRLAVTDLRSYVLGQDIIYVGGGNTRNMLIRWREWGLDVILREAMEKGTILCGVSAGSICWFEQGLSDSVAAGELLPLNCHANAYEVSRNNDGTHEKVICPVLLGS